MFNFFLFLFLLAKKPATYKIGLILPLTGPVQSYGIHCLRGIKIALQKQPMIELIIRDNEGRADCTVEIMEELSKKGVICIIGPIISGNAIVAGIEAKKYGIPIILPAATNTAVTTVSPYLYRICFTDKEQSNALAKFVYNSLKKHFVQIVCDTENIYSSALALHFKRTFNELGGKIELIKWASGADVSELVRKFTSDVIFLPLYYEDVILIIKEAKKNGITATFVGGDGWDSPELFKSLKDYEGELYFSTHYFENETAREFISTYRSIYNKKPSAFSALGYDAGRFVLMAINMAKEKNPNEILTILSKINSFEGITGTCKYDGKRDPQKEIFIIKLKEGNLSLLQKF